MSTLFDVGKYLPQSRTANVDVGELWIANFTSNTKNGGVFNFGGPYGWPCESKEGFSFSSNVFSETRVEDLRAPAVTTGAVPRSNATQQQYTNEPITAVKEKLQPVHAVLRKP